MSVIVYEAKMRDSNAPKREEPEPSASILARRHFNGPVFLSAGFRPFFWSAGLWAVISMGIWLLVLNEYIPAPGIFDAVGWHAHEMLFGFASAAMAGFLLTAVPNWTGRLPVRGAALGGLAGIWLAGRMAILFGSYLGAALAGVIDLAFLAVFFVFIMREIIIGKNWRNLPIAVVLFVFLNANLMMHLENAGIVEADGAGWRLGIVTIIMLMSL
ncbi:MAG TPA: short-chain dehydrogenase, partial [Rhizobiales bacterium]|nr:short-chain dehydrogenase [Hyphomicrobiales bacterium]